VSVRLQFKLTMPRRGSWDQKWSGENQSHTLVRNVSNEKATELLVGGRWTYEWSDGWTAQVTARRMRPGEQHKPDAGFQGYEWMVASILEHGYIRATPRPVIEAPTFGSPDWIGETEDV
jgi:hypothetical protein